MLTLVVLVLSGAALISPVPARRHATDLYVCRSLEHAGTVQEEMESENSVVAQLSADVTQLKARYTADVASLERQLSAMQSMLDTCSQRSAFMARFSARKLTTRTTGVLRFDDVIFNDGGSYDPTEGHYVAPFSGVFLFTFKVFTAERHATQRRPALDLVHNGSVVDRLAYDYLSIQRGHGGESHSLAMSLRLQRGDTVRVQTVPGYDPEELYGTFHTTFSGASLYADDSNA